MYIVATCAHNVATQVEYSPLHARLIVPRHLHVHDAQQNVGPKVTSFQTVSAHFPIVAPEL